MAARRVHLATAGVCVFWITQHAAALAPQPLPEVELFLSGATAQDEALENLFRLKAGLKQAPNICQPGTLDIYRGKIDGTAKRVFYCKTTAAVAGVPVGTRLAVHKSSGGSGEGVTPVSARTAVAYIDLAQLPPAAACAKGRAERASEDFAAYQNHTDCDAPGKAAVPRAGLSDVDPRLVGGVAEALTVKPQNQVVWGLPVTKNLRNALQAAQGLVRSSVPHDDPTRDSEANMPSLTRPVVAGMFAGSVRTWDQLYDSQGESLSRSALLAPAPPANPDVAGVSPGAYRPDSRTGNTIHVCRRIASSGTQAAYEVFYLRSRCVEGAPAFVTPNDGSDIHSGGNPARLVRVPKPAGSVFAGVGTGDVRECLDAHEQFNRWAVGILSTESAGNNGNREFRYIKVDGAAPTLLNAHRGRWQHVSEQSMQWLKSYDPARNGSHEGKVLSFIATNLGLPRVLQALNTGFRHSWGDGGYLAPASSGFPAPSMPISVEALRANPVAGITLALGGLNNCHEPLATGRIGL